MRTMDAIIQEFTHEAANTRKLLARIPGDRFDWRPHPKSMPLGRLAVHVAEIGFWVDPIVHQDELAFDPATYTPPHYDTVPALLGAFDAATASALAALNDLPDSRMTTSWRLIAGDRVLFELPRIGVIRSMVLNHGIHHRGQLTVYLRLNDVALPAIYGPSADEA